MPHFLCRVMHTNKLSHVSIFSFDIKTGDGNAWELMMRKGDAQKMLTEYCNRVEQKLNEYKALNVNEYFS